MFIKRLLRHQKAHTISIGDGVTVIVPVIEALDLECPNTLEIQIEARGADDVAERITVKFSNLSSAQPKISIDAPRDVPIRHESSSPLCEPD